MKTKKFALSVRFIEQTGETMYCYCIYVTAKRPRAFCVPKSIVVNNTIYLTADDMKDFEIPATLYLCKYNDICRK